MRCAWTVGASTSRSGRSGLEKSLEKWPGEGPGEGPGAAIALTPPARPGSGPGTGGGHGGAGAAGAGAGAGLMLGPAGGPPGVAARPLLRLTWRRLALASRPHAAPLSGPLPRQHHHQLHGDLAPPPPRGRLAASAAHLHAQADPGADPADGPAQAPPSYEALGLSAPVAQAMRHAGYRTPAAVQVSRPPSWKQPSPQHQVALLL